MHSDKVMPQAIDLERAILGGILYDQNCLYKVSGMLTKDSFYLSEHILIWGSIIRLSDKRQSIDVLAVIEDLKSVGQLANAGGAFLITQLTDSYSVLSQLESHAAILVQKQVRRGIINLQTLARMAYDDTVDAFDLKDKIHQAVIGLDGHLNVSNKITMAQAAEEFNKNLVANDGEMKGLATGWKSLDDLLLGLDGGDFIILAARPGMGKTAFALQMAKKMSNAGIKAPFISIEMPGTQLFERLVAMSAKVPLASIKIPKNLMQSEHNKILDAVSKLANNDNLTIEDCVSLTLLQFKSAARKLKDEGAQIIFLDYIQMMTIPGFSDDTAMVTRLSNGITATAKELGIPIIALSQLSRPKKGVTPEPPILSDLRQSGSLEQDAGKVIFIHRPEYYDPNTEEKGVAYIIVAKNRNGDLGVLEWKFIGKHMTFKEDDFSLPEIDDEAAHFTSVRDIGEAGQKDFKSDFEFEQ